MNVAYALGYNDIKNSPYFSVHVYLTVIQKRAKTLMFNMKLPRLKCLLLAYKFNFPMSKGLKWSVAEISPLDT